MSVIAMMKKLLSLCLLLCLLAPVLPARAMDPGTDPLGWEELSAWAAAYLDRALSSELLNDPHDNQAFTEDGYAYVYDFGTLFMSHPDMDEGCRLMGLVLIEEEEARDLLKKWNRRQGNLKLRRKIARSMK